MFLISLLAAACGRAPPPPPAAESTSYTTQDFTIVLPPGAITHDVQRSDLHEIVIRSSDDSSYTMFIRRYQESETLSLHALVQREFVADSITSKQNDWGVPGPVRPDTVGGIEAWTFEPTCGDCTMFNTYIMRGHTVLRFQAIYSENTAVWSSQRAVYSAILASFHWQGA